MDMEYKEDAIDKVLTDLGLTKYEAMVYRSLIKLGEAKALEIAQTSGVPREKTYQVLRELENKGIVKRIDGKPRRWVALPPNAIFEEVITEKKKAVVKMEKIVKEMQKLYEAGSRRSERKDLNVWEIGENGFEESFLPTLSYANISIKALLTPMGLINLSYHGLDIIKKLYKKDVNVKILTWIYEDNLHELAKLRQYTEVYILRGRPTDISFYIIDGKTGYIIRDGREYIIQYTDPRLAHVITQVFQKLLSQSIDVEEHIQYWDTTETLENSDILYPDKSLTLVHQMLSNIVRGELRNKNITDELCIPIKEVLIRNIPDYDNLHIISKVQLVNLLLKKDPLFNNVSISIDIPSETVIFDIILDGEKEWIYEIKEYRNIVPPSPYVVILLDELNELGWKEVQTTWIEDKRPERPLEHRKIRIIKKFEAPL